MISTGRLAKRVLDQSIYIISQADWKCCTAPLHFFYSSHVATPPTNEKPNPFCSFQSILQPCWVAIIEFHCKCITIQIWRLFSELKMTSELFERNPFWMGWTNTENYEYQASRNLCFKKCLEGSSLRVIEITNESISIVTCDRQLMIKIKLVTNLFGLCTYSIFFQRKEK